MRKLACKCVPVTVIKDAKGDFPTFMYKNRECQVGNLIKQYMFNAHCTGCATGTNTGIASAVLSD